MTVTEPTPEAEVADTVDDGPAGQADAVPADEGLVEEDLLVEEISIDGMCGVY